MDARVLHNRPVHSRAKVLPGRLQILEAVAKDPAGIGFGRWAPQPQPEAKVKVMALRANTNSAAILPTKDAVFQRTYALADGIYAYVNPSRKTANTRKFVDWLRSSEAQAYLKEFGFEPARPER
jgi:ABC-type phosphate transport system substrate-binding protein